MTQKEGVSGFAKLFVYAVAAGWIVLLTGGIVIAFLIHAQKLSTAWLDYGSMILVLLSGSVTALVAGAKQYEKRIVMCLSGTGLYFLSLVSVAIVLFDGLKKGVVPTLLLMLGGSVIAWLMGTKRGRKRKYRLP